MSLSDPRRLRVGILETGRVGRTLNERHGDFPDLVQGWLGPQPSYQRCAVLDGEMPAATTDADLWVITGSIFGVYEDHAFIAPMEDFIRRCAHDGVHMFGICFGHQLMAQAMGGVVRKSSRGWGVGRHSYAVQQWPSALGPGPQTLSLAAYHQDQVEELPPSALRVAGSEFCPNAALFYPGWGFSVQGHPEFSPAYVSDLIGLNRGKSLPEDIAQRGLTTLSEPTHAAVLADVVCRAWL